MSNNIHFGDEITRHGGHSLGELRHPGPPDPQLALRELTAAARVMRTQLPAPDRRAVDECLAVLRTAAGPDTAPAQSAFSRLAGIATTAGLPGAPVQEALHPLHTPAPV